MNEDIKKKIEEKAEQYRYATDHVKMCRLTGYFGYSLAEKEMNKWAQEYEICKRVIESKAAEIERLKRLMVKLYSDSWNTGAGQKQDPEEWWGQFKTENKL